MTGTPDYLQKLIQDTIRGINELGTMRPSKN